MFSQIASLLHLLPKHYHPKNNDIVLWTGKIGGAGSRVKELRAVTNLNLHTGLDNPAAKSGTRETELKQFSSPYLKGSQELST